MLEPRYIQTCIVEIRSAVKLKGLETVVKHALQRSLNNASIESPYRDVTIAAVKAGPPERIYNGNS